MVENHWSRFSLFWMLRATVTEFFCYCVAGDGMNAYMSYKVSTQVHKSFPVTFFGIVQATYINIMALYHASLSLSLTPDYTAHVP